LKDEVRYKAAEAVVALAHRAESAGRKDTKSAKGKQWQPMPFGTGLMIDAEKLREAAAYYEIAESIDRAAAGFGYPRAMLLESLGAWDEAIAAFKAVDGSYVSVARAAVSRCKQKRDGKYDEFATTGDDIEIDADALAAQLDAKLQKFQQASAAAPGKSKKGGSSAVDEQLGQQAADTALAFVNLLLDRNYKGAHAMLHKWDSGVTPDELREEFEPLFEDEDFPQAANVFDVKTDSPQLEPPDDVAWVYVSISSENAEAVSMIVTRDKKKLVVRSVEFGRP
jgi:hypothetical protein